MNATLHFTTMEKYVVIYKDKIINSKWFKIAMYMYAQSF